jgi:RNA polymerase primary sigma factor
MVKKVRVIMDFEGSHKYVSHDTLSTYLREISKFSITTREEEEQLAMRIQQGDQEALRRLVEGNLKFVVKVAQGYQGCGLSLPDLINEGNIGLIEAAKRFDPSKGVKFISYAVWWIRQAIMQALAEQSGAVRLPLKQAGLLYKISQLYNEMIQENNGREPTPEELSEKLDVPVKDVENIMRISRNYLSLDAPLSDGEDSTTFIDFMEAKQYPAADEILLNQSFQDQFEELLKGLDPREEKILRLRYGLDGQKPMTLEEVGKLMNLSRERVRQIESRTKHRLRHRALAKRLRDYLN